MNLIECRSCDVPDCTGCNLHRLAFALRCGLFDACKDDHNAVHIASEVAPVVHGEWIGRSENDSAPFCSICGRTRYGSSLEYCKKYVPFCEYCGAKMDGERKDGAE